MDSTNFVVSMPILPLTDEEVAETDELQTELEEKRRALVKTVFIELMERNRRGEGCGKSRSLKYALRDLRRMGVLACGASVAKQVKKAIDDGLINLASFAKRVEFSKPGLVDVLENWSEYDPMPVLVTEFIWAASVDGVVVQCFPDMDDMEARFTKQASCYWDYILDVAEALGISTEGL